MLNIRLKVTTAIVCLLGIVCLLVFSPIKILATEQKGSLKTDNNDVGEEEVSSFVKNTKAIEDVWPGQTMMEDEFLLIDTKWQPISLANSANSITTFPIEVEGFETGTLIGHIRFGGVNSNTGVFEKDTAKQLRNLVFIVENTKAFKDKDKKVTVKYTYNYYQGTNNTYSMVPITDLVGNNTVHEIPNDKDRAFEVPLGGQPADYRYVKELFIQEVGSTGTFAVQARTAVNQGIFNLDFYFQQIKTLIPTKDGGIRIVNEVKNTGWRTGAENKFPRKTFGAMIGEDTMLNEIDQVPIFSLGPNKGVYIANKLDLFRVAFPRLTSEQGGADNYEGQSYNSIFGKTYSAFQKTPYGYGNEGQAIQLDQRVWPANGVRPPLSGNISDPEETRGYDTQYVQKWNPRQPPEVGEKAIMSYDVNVLPIYKPEIKINEESQNQRSYKDKTLTFNGVWRDYDSLNVTLYYQIGSQAKHGWIEFKRESRNDTELEKDQWFDFSLDLLGSAFKLNGDTISFKAVDTTQVSSEIVTTDVTVFDKVNIKTEHYDDQGKKLAESSFEGVPGDDYVTKANDYSDLGLKLDESQTSGAVSGIIPTEDVLVKYYYKKGVVTVVTHYLKEDDSELFPSTELKLEYNKTYQTDDRLEEAKELNYYFAAVIGEPHGNTGKEDRQIEVTYKYRHGVLGIIQRTEALDFGSHPLITLGSKDIYPTTDTHVKIIDELQGNWRLNLRIANEFKVGESPLIGEVYFQTKDKGLLLLNGSGQGVHERAELRAGEIDLSWQAAKKEGLFIRQQRGNQKGVYNGTLEWNIVSGL